MVKDGEIIDFTYDASGTPLNMKVGNTTYYYITNLQGDVMGLMDSTGTVVVSYSYTAYGVVTATGNANVISLNPLTYRGYVYDPETGLYYLQSRYYDPSIGRFINADGLIATGQGFTGNNMFAYCGNNPVHRCDHSGNCWHNKKWGTPCDKCKKVFQGLKNVGKAICNAAVDAVQWTVENVVEPATDFVQEITSYIPEHTRSVGNTASAAYWGGATVSAGITYDTKGNVGLIVSGGFGSGSPNASFGAYSNVTTARDIYEQNGLCYNIGASGSYDGFSVGGDVMTFSGANTGKTCYGASGVLGLGYSPLAGEVHAEATYSKVFGFNIYEMLDKLYKAIEEW